MIILYMLSAVSVSFIIHLFMHEIGHMIGGYVTGWRFLYLQVCNFAVVRCNSGIRIKFTYIPVSNNQCIMYPNSPDMGAGIYTMSGCYMNLVLAMGGLVILLYNLEDMVLRIYSWCFFLIGIAFYLMNAIPNTKRICNDMACRILLETDYITRVCHNSQLIIARYLSEGYTYKGICKDLIFLSGYGAMNDILAYQAVLEYYYYLEAGEYEQMKEVLEGVDMEAPISREVLDIIIMEKLYCELIIYISRSTLFSIPHLRCSKDINEYIGINKEKKDVHNIRIATVYHAYEYMLQGRQENAGSLLSAGIRMLKDISCLYEGERLFCINQLNMVLGMCELRESLSAHKTHKTTKYNYYILEENANIWYY